MGNIPGLTWGSAWNLVAPHRKHVEKKMSQSCDHWQLLLIVLIGLMVAIFRHQVWLFVLAMVLSLCLTNFKLVLWLVAGFQELRDMC